jgi:transcriptional regulator with XRE-family HTH domain
MLRNVYQAHIPVKGKCASHGVETAGARVHDAHRMTKARKKMPASMAKPTRSLRVTAMRAWRVAKGFTLEAAGAVVDLSHSQLGRVERGEQPYNQELLEGLAALYGCSPSDLIDRDPNANAADARWNRLSPSQRERAMRLLEAAEGTSDAMDRKQPAA